MPDQRATSAVVGAGAEFEFDLSYHFTQAHALRCAITADTTWPAKQSIFLDETSRDLLFKKGETWKRRRRPLHVPLVGSCSIPWPNGAALC